MPERRIFARHTPTALTYVSAGDNNGGILLNVSEAGCALQLVSPPPTLSDVNLDLDLGSTLPRIEVNGKVIWADETGCTGIRFAHLSEVARQTIRRFVENNPADAAMPEIGVELEEEIGTNGLLSPLTEEPQIASAEPEEVLFDAVEQKSFEEQLFELSTGAAFVALVEQCRSATGASSAALALLKSREMLCRASCGKGAPPTGARLDITSERSFTAQCVSTATTLRCVDSQTDSRVNAAVCQRLGIRSVTAMPLIHKEQVVGVLEVFSSERDAFSESHIAALERLGKLAVDFAIARNEVTLAASAPAAAWPAIAKPAAPRTENLSAAAAPPAVKAAPSFSSTYTSAAAVAVAPAASSQPNSAAAAAVARAPIAVPSPAKNEPIPQRVAEAPAIVEKRAESKPEAAQAATSSTSIAPAKPAAAAQATPSTAAPASSLAPIFGQTKSATASQSEAKPQPKPEIKPPAAKVEVRKPTEPVISKAATIAPARNSAPAVAPVSSARVFEAPPASKPAAVAASAAAPVSEPVRKPDAPPRHTAPKPATTERFDKRADGQKVGVAASAAAAAAKPKKDDRFEVAPLAEDPIPAWTTASSTSTQETVFGAEGAASKRTVPMIAAAAVLTLALIGGGVWKYRASHKAAAMPAVQVSAAPAELPVQEVQVTASSSQSSSQPAGASSSTSTKEKEKEKETQSSKESKSSSSSNASEKKNGDSAEKSSDSANKASEAQPKVIALAQTSEFRRPQGGDVAPPKITSSAALPTLLGANATPSLPSLSVPQPASSGPLKVSSAALSDRLIRRLEPQYPEIARRSGLGGAVRIRLEIGVDGKVKSATVLEGAPVLGAAARDAVLQWRYRPYVIDNRPVPIETEIIVRFTAR